MTRTLCSLLTVLWLALPSAAQELEPRRWSHLPVNTNFFGGGYAYTEGTISFDPALQIEGAEVALHTVLLSYIRTFELWGKTARVDVVQGWRDAHWSGKLAGVDTTVDRTGLTDTRLRFSISLVGAPPLSGRDYAAYRAAATTETIVGAALLVQLPTGQYLEDKLLNLGDNRYMFQPQLGVVHRRGNWTFEATGALDFFTTNRSFFGGNTRKQDPFFSLQTHAVYNFTPGFWVSASLGYGNGAASTVNGVAKNDRREFVAWALSAGYAVSDRVSLKAAYLGTRRQRDFGLESDSFVIGMSTFW